MSLGGTNPGCSLYARTNGQISPPDKSLLKIESAQLQSFPANCKKDFSVVVLNYGKIPFAGDLHTSTRWGDQTVFLSTGNQFKDTVNISAGQRVTLHHSIELFVCDCDRLKIMVGFRSGQPIDTIIVLDPQTYSGQILSANEHFDRSHFLVQFTNTSTAALNFNLQFYKGHDGNPTAWTAHSFYSTGCVNAGASQQSQWDLPAGWPTTYNMLKVCLQKGTRVLDEKIFVHKPLTKIRLP